MLSNPKRFPHFTFDEITVYGKFYLFFRDGHTQSWRLAIVFSSQNGKRSIAQSYRLFENKRIFLGL